MDSAALLVSSQAPEWGFTHIFKLITRRLRLPIKVLSHIAIPANTHVNYWKAQRITCHTPKYVSANESKHLIRAQDNQMILSTHKNK